jgi:hypothetical protein
MESQVAPAERSSAVRRALRPLRFPMDIFVYTPAEVAEHRGRIGNLLSYVEADGRVLYERP